MIKDAIIKLDNSNEVQLYYMGKDGHVWTSPMGEPYARKANAIKAILREEDYSYNSNFTKHDETTYTYVENGKWFHLAQVIEVQ